MLLLVQTLGLLSIIYIEFFLPLGCKAALDGEEISMKYVEDDPDRFHLKPSRKLFDVEDNHIMNMNTSTLVNDRPWFWFCVFVFVILFVLILVRCCIKLASEENEQTAEITVHPPPRIQSYIRSAQIQPSSRSYRNIQPSTRPYANSRPFAPPRTDSRSLILLPEPGDNHDMFFAIENPNFSLFTISLHANEQINHEPSNITSRNKPTEPQDLPPDYDSIVTDNQHNGNRSTQAVNIPDDSQNSEKMSPPKYEDLH